MQPEQHQLSAQSASFTRYGRYSALALLLSQGLPVASLSIGPVWDRPSYWAVTAGVLGLLIPRWRRYREEMFLLCVSVLASLCVADAECLRLTSPYSGELSGLAGLGSGLEADFPIRGVAAFLCALSTLYWSVRGLLIAPTRAGWGAFGWLLLWAAISPVVAFPTSFWLRSRSVAAVCSGTPQGAPVEDMLKAARLFDAAHIGEAPAHFSWLSGGQSQGGHWLWWQAGSQAGHTACAFRTGGQPVVIIETKPHIYERL